LHLLDADNRESPYAKGVTLDENLRKKSTRANDESKRVFERFGGQFGKGILNFEYSDHGTGDFRTPSFVVVDTYDGSSITPIRYRRHAIHKGKIPMPDHMPGIRFLNDMEATTLVVTMADSGSELEVDLIYGKIRRYISLFKYLYIVVLDSAVVIHNYDAITRRVVFRNIDTRGSYGSNHQSCKYNEATKVVQRASSFSMDFENTSSPFYLVQLSGR
jgi:alpha-galactosidase